MNDQADQQLGQIKQNGREDVSRPREEKSTDKGREVRAGSLTPGGAR